jgi:hypothetical protein
VAKWEWLPCRLCADDSWLRVLAFDATTYPCPRCGGKRRFRARLPRLDPAPPGRLERWLRRALAALRRPRR